LQLILLSHLPAS